MAPRVPPRLQLQLGHLQDMIREQDRMVLADVEPTESDRADMMDLLSSIKHNIEEEGSALVEHLREPYVTHCASLSELGYNVDSYTLSVVPVTPPPGSVELDLSASTANPDLEFGPSPSLRPSSIRSSSKPGRRVHFAQNLSESRDPEPLVAQYSDEPDDLSSLSSAQLYDGNQLLMEDQDRRLERIGESVGRQRVLGEHINDELQVHNNMLEDFEAQIDRSDSRLTRLTGGVRAFNKKSRECGVCSVILLLVLILFIVIII